MDEHFVQSVVAERRHTRTVQVGNVKIGGRAPISVQSMCNTATSDTQATLAQISELVRAGAKLVRVTLPKKEDVTSFALICKKSPVPIIADIHFDWRLAIAAAQSGASAIRINPGNIGTYENVDEILKACKAHHIPIRIGVNAGSLEKSVASSHELTEEEKLVFSAKKFAQHFEKMKFSSFVVSAKVHSVAATVRVNRMLAKCLSHIPLHLGVTEAGTLLAGTVKNTAALTLLLSEGIGDTIRVSLTADPVEEVRVGAEILQNLNLCSKGVEVISCPTCGRTHTNLIEKANLVEAALASVEGPLTVAVMGCVVNGPGEARSADIGLAFGNGFATLFKQGEPIARVSEAKATEALLQEIAAMSKT